ncbi:hypothetical protein ACFVWR_07485 [Leifsonia sp. NPDC058292]|uniref:FitA-like ribbon-helix-helix domain-containing protein n=1 Tax=Leifsonia sp. NPDC058292 TaxID=3346428 RepID=UPI0036DF229B
MGVTVQVRDLDPSVNDRLKAAAAAKGLSYSEYLRRELTRIAERMRVDERWAELERQTEEQLGSLRESAELPREAVENDIDRETIVRWIREDRDR